MIKFFWVAVLMDALSQGAQLLQFGPVTRSLKQQGFESWVPPIMGIFWGGALVASFWRGSLLDKYGHKRLLCWILLPVVLCPWGYLVQDPWVLLVVRFFHGFFIGFIAVTIRFLLRSNLPEEPKIERPEKFSVQVIRQAWSNNPHQRGVAISKTVVTVIGTVGLATLGFYWIQKGWSSTLWAFTASILAFLSVVAGMLIPEPKKEQQPEEEQPEEEEEEQPEEASAFFAIIPGIGMGVIGSAFVTYLPLYTPLIAVSLVIAMRNLADNVGTWIAAFLPRAWENRLMVAGLAITAAGTISVSISSTNISLLTVGGALIGLGVSLHRVTFELQLWVGASKKGRAVSISNASFEASCLIGIMWGYLAPWIGYRGVFLSGLIFLGLPLWTLLKRRRT